MRLVSCDGLAQRGVQLGAGRETSADRAVGIGETISN